jgi:hypothetical protein
LKPSTASRFGLTTAISPANPLLASFLRDLGTEREWTRAAADKRKIFWLEQSF